MIAEPNRISRQWRSEVTAIVGALLALCIRGAVLQARPLSPPNEAAAETVENSCMIVAKEKNLTGKALQSSISACIAQERPDLAYWESCRASGRKKHLKGEILQSFTRMCLNSSAG